MNAPVGRSLFLPLFELSSMDPERIGPYVIDHKIGSGGMGTVYLAMHAETQQEVALKVLPPSLAREEGFVVRFEREIQSLQKLINPHVVTLLDHGVDNNDIYYYAMEYVEGETLGERLRREKRLPWRDVVNHSLQICSALKAAHDAGIVHRDLKPSNLLLDQHNNVKLTDFGVAQMFASGRLTMHGAIIGTAEYMSPEQANGQRATKKSDLYSLGAVMYTMLTGRPPFVGKTTLDVIRKHQQGQFDRPSRYVEGFPPRLEDIICQLLEKDPEKRFADAFVLSRRLQELLRRADLADQPETNLADALSTSEEQSATVFLDSDSEPPDQAVGGTLMRDLVREELDRTLAPSPLGRWLDNTWVLLGLLALLIAGGVLWFQSLGEPTDEETTAEQRAAETRLFREAQQPLEESLRTTPPRDTDEFLRRAIQALEAANPAKADKTLAALDVLLSTQEAGGGAEGVDKLRAAIKTSRETLGEIQLMRPRPAPEESLARKSLRRAEALRTTDLNQSRQIWHSLIELYDEDPHSQQEVREARDWLRKTDPAPGASTADAPLPPPLKGGS